MSKRIALDALMLSKSRAGVGNYQYNLINSLKQFPYTFDVYVSDPGAVVPSKNVNIITIPQIADSKKRLMFQAFKFADLINKSNYDLVHFLDYMTPKKHLNCPFVVTVHDLSFCTDCGYFTKSAALFKKLQLPRALKNSAEIVTVSEFTKAEILKYFPKTNRDKITPIHLGINIPYVKTSKIPEGINKPYVLFVGTVEPRKNIIFLIKSMEILWASGDETELVIAGKFGWLYDKITDYAKNSRFSEKIKFTGFVSDEELESLYNHAEVFAFPSVYEGFGLPPLEAMKRKLAVVSTRVTAMPEILGNGAYFASSCEEFAEKIHILTGKSQKKLELISRGYARSCNFTWKKTAEQTTAVYEKIFRSET